jgi:putative spermidine/putrescine transport system ATP-binding protein
MAYVELESLHRVFGDVVALQGIELSLEQGEFLSLLGPSGCGKTTALRLVAGFDRATSGRILVDGKDMTRVPPNKRDMGMVFQAYSLFPNMTAARNVEFGLKIRGASREERARKVEDLLELVGLGHAGSRYPHQLSGGMQQRVALARALAIEPRVLLLDEPLSALDAKVRVQLREEIRRIQTRLGITTIYVTHDQEEALSISDRVAVLSQGKIEQIGTPADIYGSPETPFVAEFVGTMNRLEATIADPASGEVEYAGHRISVDVARGRRHGERVLVLVRPETVELELVANGGGLAGEIVSHAFLGAVMRLKVAVGEDEVTADVPASRAGAYSVGTRVAVRFPSDSPRLLSL